MDPATVWCADAVMRRYHKLRPPFIWQRGDSHLSMGQVKEAMTHACNRKTICDDAEWPVLIKG